MKVLETKEIDIRDIIIGRCLVRPIEEMKEDDDLKNLSDSIDEVGQLHPCFVRMVGNRHELIAGGRRYVALCRKRNKIEVKVVIASDLEAMELGQIENGHRKDPDLNRRDKRIYTMWKMGKMSGRYKYIRDLAKKISMNEDLVSRIITAGKDKEKNDSDTFQKASVRELESTRSLADHPELREKVLNIGKRNDISTKDIGQICKNIKKSIEGGVDKKIVEKAIDLVLPSKDMSIDMKVDRPTESIPVDIRPKKLEEILNTLKVSPPDVKEKIIKKEISLKDAKELNKFSTVEARDQVLKEIKIIENKKELANRVYDMDREMNIETRKKQQEDMKKKGETSLKTEFDIELDKKLEMESNKDDIHDEEFIDRYQRLSSYTLETFSHFHPKRLRTVEGKKTVLKIVRNLYDFYHTVLVDVGEIKDIRTEDGSIKRLEVGDVEIIKRA